ncbi:MAG: hypothetical protein RLZZ546_1612, partial [Bacteroidota bacterium]
MNILKSKKDIIGFDDRWLVVIGIPLVALIVDVLLFGPKLLSDFQMLKICYPIGLYFTTMLWLVFREVICVLITHFPSDEEIRKRQIISIITIIIGFFILDYLFGVILFIVAKENIHGLIEPNFLLKSISSLIFCFLIFSIYEGI